MRRVGLAAKSIGAAYVGHFAEEVELVEHNTRAFRHRTQGIFGDMNWQAGLFRGQLVDAPQKGTTTRENKSTVHQVRRKFRRTSLESDANRLDDGRNRFVQSDRTSSEVIVKVFGRPRPDRGL